MYPHFLQCINLESDENILRRFPTSPVLAAFYWYVTEMKHKPNIPKHISFFGGTISLCVVLKTAYLQRKTSFAHIGNCALLNVRFKGQTRSLRLYNEGCRKNCCSSEESCYLHNSVPAGSLQLVHPYELINIKEVDLINERVYFP